MSSKTRSDKQSGVKADTAGEPPLPEYSPPTKGFLSILPASWVPFAELARFDKPVGIYLFYWPHLWGTLYAAAAVHGPASRGHNSTSGTSTSSEIPLAELLRVNVILFVGSLFVRAAACAWNDNLDREYDRKVLRCRLRPLARGAISPFAGYVWAGVLAACAAACLYPLPQVAWVVAVPNIFLLWFYPFTKRFTDFPQAVLGTQLGLSLPLAVAATDDGAAYLKSLYDSAVVQGNWLQDKRLWALAAFCATKTCWVMIYDTIYAHQDLEDDLKAGVRSIAVHFRGNPKPFFWAVAAVQVSLLLAAGSWQGFEGLGYKVVGCGGTAISLAYMIATVDLTNKAECAWWFTQGFWYVGLSVAGGLALEAFGY